MISLTSIKCAVSWNDFTDSEVSLQEKINWQADGYAQFVEKLKATPPRKDVKLQLLLEIALESDLQWDSKALEQKLYNPPAPEQVSFQTHPYPPFD